jgi:hypothetical protein
MFVSCSPLQDSKRVASAISKPIAFVVKIAKCRACMGFGSACRVDDGTGGAFRFFYSQESVWEFEGSYDSNLSPVQLCGVNPIASFGSSVCDLSCDLATFASPRETGNMICDSFVFSFLETQEADRFAIRLIVLWKRSSTFRGIGTKAKSLSLW